MRKPELIKYILENGFADEKGSLTGRNLIDYLIYDINKYGSGIRFNSILNHCQA